VCNRRIKIEVRTLGDRLPMSHRDGVRAGEGVASSCCVDDLDFARWDDAAVLGLGLSLGCLVENALAQSSVSELQRWGYVVLPRRQE
jgi:hypothetical protein